MTGSSKAINILIIEDNTADYQLLKEYLKQMTVQVKKLIHAVNMGVVPSLIKNNLFDIVLLDLSLPDSTGIDSVKVIDRLLPNVPIIILSGMPAAQFAAEAISLGAQDYLIKGEFEEKLLGKTIQYSIERKKILEKLNVSNERYKLISKATLDTTWDWNFETNIGQWGEGILRTFGYSEENLLFNLEIWNKFIHPDDIERVTRNLHYHLENHIKNWQDEYRFQAADGSYKDVFSRGYLLFSEDGIPSRMFGSTTDITERKRLEKELAIQQLNQQKLITETTILAQEKQRNELGKELHDNINQILATVKIYLSVMKNDHSPEILAKCSEYVNHAIEEIRKLSKSLVSPSLGNTGLKEALEDLVDEINMTHALEIELNYEVGQEKMIGGKKELMIYRIVQEQINNILKHAHAEKAFITLKTEGKNLLLSIDDNGVGFDVKAKSKGIGLKNISSRVEFYNGKINIVSEPGKGCKFEIIISC